MGQLTSRDVASNIDCIELLQWALPKRSLRWGGFRKVRGQVCKRLKRRMIELGLDSYADYRSRLETDPAEWERFDECCHITISRFFREQAIFEVLRSRVLPDIAARGVRERREVNIWSAGCASGEEPYTLRILWDLEVAESYPGVSLRILATDVDKTMLERALNGCFEPSSLRELPAHIPARAFDRLGPLLCVKTQHREGIDFVYQDLQREVPSRMFDLILCRYVAFTYFAPELQQQVLARMVKQLEPGGYLTIGAQEQLPGEAPSMTPLDETLHILRKRAASAHQPDKIAAPNAD